MPALCIFARFCRTAKHAQDIAAADGQMGQIMHAWLDWMLSGDDALLRRSGRGEKGPRVRLDSGGWDANRDGVMEGVQHNTYDVEFHGPNPLCGIYYLGALRAGEEMARAAGDIRPSGRYQTALSKAAAGSTPISSMASITSRQVRGFRQGEIAGNLRSSMGSEDTEHPGIPGGSRMPGRSAGRPVHGDVCGLGALVSPDKIRSTLNAIYRYNYKRTWTNTTT